MSVASIHKKAKTCKRGATCAHHWRTMTLEQVRKVESRESALDSWKRRKKGGKREDSSPH